MEAKLSIGKEEKIKAQNSSLLVILLAYFVPFLLLIFYIFYLSASWALFSIGLLISSFGSSVLFWYICYREGEIDEMPDQKNADAEETYSEPIVRIEKVVETVVEKVESPELIQEAALWKQRHTELQEKWIEYQKHMESIIEEWKKQKLLLSEYELKNQQQQDLIDKQQEEITQLIEKQTDLNYEVETLLSLDLQGPKVPDDTMELNMKNQEQNFGYMFFENRAPYTVPKSQPRTEDQDTPSTQLKACLDIATKMSGAYSFHNNHSSLWDLPVDNYALDLRRLSDSLQSSCHYFLLLFSIKDNKVIFVNDKLKEALGWTSEQIFQNYLEYIQDSLEEWKKGINSTTFLSETKFQMLIKSKAGQTIPLQCHLGLISSGVFKGHVIALFTE